MRRKQFIALLLVVMACTSALTVGAAPLHPAPLADTSSEVDSPISLRWDNARQISCLLGINGNTAECTATVTGVSETTKITGTLTLYRQSGTSWVKVKSWPGSTNNSVLRFSEEYSVTTGYNYKLIVTASVYANGSWENVEKESAVKYCG